MNNSVTMQEQAISTIFEAITKLSKTIDVRDAELNIERCARDNAERELVEKNIVIDALKFEIANLRDRLTQNDRQWNKTIDAHEVTKQRLLGYENEAGVPKSASEREVYMSYNPK